MPGAFRLYSYILLAVSMSAGLAALGFWQLDRAGAKRALLDGVDAALAREPVALHEALADPAGARFRRVWAEGRFLADRQILLDNQLREGRPGVRVYLPFEADGEGALLLVDGGWLPLPRRDAPLPSLEVQTETQRLEGILLDPPGAGIRLGEDPEAGWPWLATRIDLANIENRLGRPLLPWVFEYPSPDQAASIRAGMLPPERHLGYAVQWFGLALAMLAILAVLLWRRQAGRRAMREGIR